MKPTISSTGRTRLALVAFASLWLAACGGGGGGDAAPAPPPLASAGGSPPASPPASAAAFQPWGPSVVDTSVGPEAVSSVARLSSGASVVAWVKDGALQAQRFDVSGAKLGTALRIAQANARAFSIAPLAHGDWIATWGGSTPGATGQTVLFQRFTAAGEAIGGPTQAGGVYAAVDAAPVARPTADGGFVIGWSARPGDPQQPSTAYVARFAAGGTSLGGPVAVSAGAADQGRVGVNPLSNGTVLVTWTQALGQGTAGYARPFDASGQPSGPERQIVAANPVSGSFAAAPVAGNRVAVAWGFPGTQLNWQVLDASGAPVGGPASSAGTGEMTRVAVVDAGGGSFNVLYQNAEQTPRSNTSTISVQRVDASGAADGAPSVIVRRRLSGLLPATGGPAPEASPEFSASGGADGHYVVSYQVSADTSAEVHAQAK